MSTIKYVKGTIVQKNTVPLLPGLNGGTPIVRDIDCENVTVVGVEYLVPLANNGILEGYSTRIINYPTDTPPPDAIRTLRLHDRENNDTIWIAVDNSKDEVDFAEFCNQCCGSGNDYTFSGTLPAPILEQHGCAVPAAGSATYSYQSTAPANPFGSNYSLAGFTYNYGTQPPVAPLTAGHASVAAAATWANSNWGSLGTWSAAGNTLKVVSTNMTDVNLNVTLLPLSYCMTLPGTAFTANALVVKDASNADVSITIPALTTSSANANAVQTALQNRLVGTVIVVSGSPNKIQYTGLQKPVKLTDGTNNATFASGVC